MVCLSLCGVRVFVCECVCVCMTACVVYVSVDLCGVFERVCARTCFRRRSPLTGGRVFDPSIHSNKTNFFCSFLFVFSFFFAITGKKYFSHFFVNNFVNKNKSNCFSSLFWSPKKRDRDIVNQTQR